METNELGTQTMVFLKSLGQKYFSIPSEVLWFYPVPSVVDETGAVAVVPSSDSDDELTAKQNTEKSKKLQNQQKTKKAKDSEASLTWEENNAELC